MLRQVRRFECSLGAADSLSGVNEFLRQLHGAGVRSIEVLAVPGIRESGSGTDTLYVVFEPAEEPDLLAVAVADVAVEILEPNVVADALGNGGSKPELARS